MDRPRRRDATGARGRWYDGLVIIADRLDRVPVRLIFTTGDDAFQNVIRTTTRSPATHAALALGDHGETLLHAYEDGVQIDSRDRWLGEKGQVLVAEYRILPDVTDGVASAMAHVGKRYDVLHVVKIAVMRVLRLVRLGKPEDNDAFTCARFVMVAIDPAGTQIPEWNTIPRDAAVPADLLAAAEAGPSFYRLA